MFIKHIRTAIFLIICLALPFSTFGATVELLDGVVIVRDKGKPQVEVFNFEANHPVETYILSIYNGGKDNHYCRISSAIITLNGVQVFSPNNFNKKAHLLQKDTVLGLVK